VHVRVCARVRVRVHRHVNMATTGDGIVNFADRDVIELLYIIVFLLWPPGWGLSIAMSAHNSSYPLLITPYFHPFELHLNWGVVFFAYLSSKGKLFFHTKHTTLHVCI